MYVHDEAPPAWITDDAEVGRRIVRRAHDTVGAEAWWAVAETGRCCRALTAGDLPGEPAAARVQLRLAGRALRETTRLAMLLPPPLPLVEGGPPTWCEPADHLLAWGPRTDVVNTTATALCGELASAEWTCPDRLAGLVDDVRLALEAYLGSLLTIIELAPATHAA
jgi:hypothetical protein